MDARLTAISPDLVGWKIKGANWHGSSFVVDIH